MGIPRTGYTVFSEADKAKLKEHLGLQNASLNKYLFVEGFRRRGGLPSVQALFPCRQRENVHTVGWKKPKLSGLPRALPQGEVAEHTPKRQSMNLHSLIVPKPLLGFSWETWCIHLQLSKFKRLAVRTPSCPAIKSCTFINGQNRETPRPQEESSGPFFSTSSHPGTRGRRAKGRTREHLQPGDASKRTSACLPQGTPSSQAVCANRVPSVEAAAETVMCKALKCVR